MLFINIHDLENLFAFKKRNLLFWLRNVFDVIPFISHSPTHWKKNPFSLNTGKIICDQSISLRKPWCVSQQWVHCLQISTFFLSKSYFELLFLVFNYTSYTRDIKAQELFCPHKSSAQSSPCNSINWAVIPTTYSCHTVKKRAQSPALNSTGVLILFITFKKMSHSLREKTYLIVAINSFQFKTVWSTILMVCHISLQDVPLFFAPYCLVLV